MSFIHLGVWYYCILFEIGIVIYHSFSEAIKKNWPYPVFRHPVEFMVSHNLSWRASGSTYLSLIRGLVNLAIRRAKQCQATYLHIAPFPTVFLEESDQMNTMLYYVWEWAFIFVSLTLYFMGICDVYINATLLPHSPNLLALTSFCITSQLKKEKYLMNKVYERNKG